MAPPPKLAARAKVAADDVLTARGEKIAERQVNAQQKDVRAQAARERELLPTRMENCVCDRELLATYLGIAPKSVGIIGVIDTLPVIVNDLAPGEDDAVGTKSDRYKLETVSGTVFKYEGVLYARYRTPSKPECFGVVQSFRDPDTGHVALRISGRFHDVASLNGTLGSASLPHIVRAMAADADDVEFDLASTQSTVKTLSKMTPRFVRIDHRSAEKFVADRIAREEAERLDAESRLWDDRWTSYRDRRTASEMIRADFALRLLVGIPGVEVVGAIKSDFLKHRRRPTNNFLANNSDHCIVLRYNDLLYVDVPMAEPRPAPTMPASYAAARPLPLTPPAPPPAPPRIPAGFTTPIPRVPPRSYALMDFRRTGAASIDFTMSGTFSSSDAMERTLHRRENFRVGEPTIDECIQFLRDQTRDFLPLDLATAVNPSREVLALAHDQFAITCP